MKIKIPLKIKNQVQKKTKTKTQLDFYDSGSRQQSKFRNINRFLTSKKIISNVFHVSSGEYTQPHFNKRHCQILFIRTFP